VQVRLLSALHYQTTPYTPRATQIVSGGKNRRSIPSPFILVNYTEVPASQWIGIASHVREYDVPALYLEAAFLLCVRGHCPYPREEPAFRGFCRQVRDAPAISC
jgi:hypothetical protein